MVAQDRRHWVGAAQPVYGRSGRVDGPAGHEQQPAGHAEAGEQLRHGHHGNPAKGQVHGPTEPSGRLGPASSSTIPAPAPPQTTASTTVASVPCRTSGSTGYGAGDEQEDHSPTATVDPRTWSGCCSLPTGHRWRTTPPALLCTTLASVAGMLLVMLGSLAISLFGQPLPAV